MPFSQRQHTKNLLTLSLTRTRNLTWRREIWDFEASNKDSKFFHEYQFSSEIAGHTISSGLLVIMRKTTVLRKMRNLTIAICERASFIPQRRKAIYGHSFPCSFLPWAWLGTFMVSSSKRMWGILPCIVWTMQPFPIHLAGTLSFVKQQ
jgi:hypothetical protein